MRSFLTFVLFIGFTIAMFCQSGEPDTMYVLLSFSEPMDTATVLNLTNYMAFNSDGTENVPLYAIKPITTHDSVFATNTAKVWKPVIENVVITTGKMLYDHEYTFLVSNVEDLAHNPIVPGHHNTAQFKYTPYRSSKDTLILKWTGGDPDGDPVTYDVYLGTSFTNLPIVSHAQVDTFYIPIGLKHYTRYYWKVVATDSHGSSTSSKISTFKTIFKKPDLTTGKK